MRARGIALAVAALAAFAAGAGASTPTAKQAQRIVSAISLRASDLRAYAQSPDPITKQELAQNSTLRACYGGLPLHDDLAYAQSPKFEASAAPYTTIGSSAAVLPNAKLPLEDLAAARRSKALVCESADVASSLHGELAAGQSLVSTKAAFIASPLASSIGAFAVRVTFVIRVTKGKQSQQVPSYADLIGFVYGQAEVSLSLITTGATPSTALEKTLAATLLARAKAALS